MYELSVEKTFAAAHFLRDFDGPCAKLHGHNYRVLVFVRGETLNSLGMVADFSDLKAALAQVIEPLDHACLNDLPAFQTANPTTENVARVVACALAERDFGPHARLDRVQVWETPNQSATYYMGRPDRPGRKSTLLDKVH